MRCMHPETLLPTVKSVNNYTSLILSFEGLSPEEKQKKPLRKCCSSPLASSTKLPLPLEQSRSTKKKADKILSVHLNFSLKSFSSQKSSVTSSCTQCCSSSSSCCPTLPCTHQVHLSTNCGIGTAKICQIKISREEGDKNATSTIFFYFFLSFPIQNLLSRLQG